MEKFIIDGGIPLKGEVEISGAKNAAIALIPAAILSDGVCRIENIPNISDVSTIVKILYELGADIKYINKSTIEIDPKKGFRLNGRPLKLRGGCIHHDNTLLGACAGFWPYNHSNRVKTFLGDSGSTLLGFIIAALCMGTGYSEHSNLGFLAPLLILAIPLFDTAFVCLMRISKGKNPLCGSNDHAALRLMKVGLSKNETLLLFTGAGVFANIFAFAVTKISAVAASAVYFVAALLLGVSALFLSRIRMKG